MTTETCPYVDLLEREKQRDDNTMEARRLSAQIDTVYKQVRDALKPSAGTDLRDQLPSLQVELERLKFKLLALRTCGYSSHD